MKIARYIASRERMVVRTSSILSTSNPKKERENIPAKRAVCTMRDSIEPIHLVALTEIFSRRRSSGIFEGRGFFFLTIIDASYHHMKILLTTCRFAVRGFVGYYYLLWIHKQHNLFLGVNATRFLSGFWWAVL